MNDATKREVLANLKRDYGMTARGDYLRGKCPSCEKKELFVSIDSPYVVKCGREGKCAWTAHTRELYPEAWGKLNERFPPTTQDPNATADAYMGSVRMLPLAAIRGQYRQGHFRHPHGNRETATVVFDIAPGIAMERLVDNVTITDTEDGSAKVRKANFIGAHGGHWWAPKGLEIVDGDEVWLVEGCIDALSLMVNGVKAVATLAAGNFPEAALNAIVAKNVTLVWALDNDKAGRDAIEKHIKAAKALGFENRAALIPTDDGKKIDWNDAHIAKKLRAEDLDRYRYHGDIFLAPDQVEKGRLIWERTNAWAFAVEYNNQTFWWHIPQEKYAKQIQEYEKNGGFDPEIGLEKCAAVKVIECVRIANCSFRFLYFMKDERTGESWYYAQIKFPDGLTIKDTFTGTHLATASEFKKRLLGIARGGHYTGDSGHLNWIVGRFLDKIRVVQTIDYVGYSKELGAYVWPHIAVKDGKVVQLNDEDFFELGKTSVKTLNRSLDLTVGDATSYRKDWIDHIWRAFGAKGIVATAWFLGSLYAEQIRAIHASYPFLEVVGQAGSGKSTLIEFLWKLVGRTDYEGFDPNKSTMSGRTRNFSQVSNLPVVLLESDREDSAHAKKFDWDELKSAFNGRVSRVTGERNNGNDTKEPRFRGSILITQNTPVSSSEAILSRLVHLFFDCAHHSTDGKNAADSLSGMPVDQVSHFLAMACMAERRAMELFKTEFPKYEKKIQDNPSVRLLRIAKCHGQIMALVDVLMMLTGMPEAYRAAAHATLMEAAPARQTAISADHPVVEEFWDVVDFIGLDVLNHSRNGDIIALNLNHVQACAGRYSQPFPTMAELKKHLPSSASRKFIERNKSVCSGLEKNDAGNGKTVKCWTFKKGNS
jgi:hypothetical protein